MDTDVWDLFKLRNMNMNNHNPSIPQISILCNDETVGIKMDSNAFKNYNY